MKKKKKIMCDPYIFHQLLRRKKRNDATVFAVFLGKLFFFFFFFFIYIYIYTYILLIKVTFWKHSYFYQSIWNVFLNMKIRVSCRKIDKGVFLNVLCIYQCLKSTLFAHRLAYTNPIMDMHERLSHKENSKANKKKKNLHLNNPKLISILHVVLKCR